MKSPNRRRRRRRREREARAGLERSLTRSR
jgi:hypothetical protein